MELIRGLHNLKPRHRGCVMTIGNFDGMHRGHQAVLGELRESAGRLDLPLLLMTFEPTPKELFAPEQAPARLTSLGEKVALAMEYGVDRMLCAHFNRRFSAQSPEAFVSDVVVDKLQPEVVMVGSDFRFGAKRAGDFDLLRQMGAEGVNGQHFKACVMPTVLLDGARISSTRVREALGQGNTGEAARLLGRPYTITGRVARGKQLGRTLNVPTANLEIRRKPAPCFGVYAVKVNLPDGRRLPGAASLGVRPTVDGEGCQLEVHLLDFAEDLYGKKLNVELQHFLRPEARFDNVEELRAAMMKDIDQVRELLQVRARSDREAL